MDYQSSAERKRVEALEWEQQILQQMAMEKAMKEMELAFQQAVAQRAISPNGWVETRANRYPSRTWTDNKTVPYQPLNQPPIRTENTNAGYAYVEVDHIRMEYRLVFNGLTFVIPVYAMKQATKGEVIHLAPERVLDGLSPTVDDEGNYADHYDTSPEPL